MNPSFRRIRVRLQLFLPLLAVLYIILSIQAVTVVNAQQQQDPTTMNGGSILAMAGKNCLAVAVDKRFGSGPQLINVTPRTVLTPHARTMVGLVGMEGDVQSLCRELSIELSHKRGRHLGFGVGVGFSDTGTGTGEGEGESVSDMVAKEMEIEPRSLSLLTSHLLYRRRASPYYVEPIVVGLEKKIVKVPILDQLDDQDDNDFEIGTEIRSETGIKQQKQQKQQKFREEIEYIPFLCAQDVIGAQSTSSSFVCSGAASKSLHGTAEALYRPNLSPEELLHVCGRAFLSALERDCLSGYGAVIYLMVGGEGIEECDLSCRND